MQAKKKKDNNAYFDIRTLLRLAAWGSGAALAMGLAVFAIRTDVGAQRLAMAYAGTQPGRPKAESLAERTQTIEETRRLAEGMRTLAADRDSLLARVTVLERNLEDVTGSIGRASEPKSDANPASSPLPAGNSISLLTGPTIMSTAVSTAAVPPPPAAPARKPGAPPPRALAPVPAPLADIAPAESTATRSDFGVDIGGGASIEALRDLWAAARSHHGAVLRDLRPVIVVVDTGKAGGIELRLVAGPLGNAGAATKICAALAAGGWSCKPAVFDGQKLAVR